MKSIKFRLWIYTSLLLFTMLLITYLMQGSIIDRFYANREKVDIAKQGQNLSETIAEKGISKDFTSEIDYVVRATGGRVSVYDSSGVLTAYSGKLMMGKIMMLEESMLAGVLSGETEYRKDLQNGMGTNIASVGVPVKSGGRVIGGVFIHIPTSPMQEAAQKLKSQFLTLFLISIAISAAGAIITSRSFTKPILKIKDASERIAKGDYDARIDIRDGSEFSQLGETINNMAGDLSKTEKLRRDFIANVSHEFRTPLGIIKGYAEAISDGIVPKNEEKEYADAIIEESDRLSGMVNGILDLAKMESGNMKLEKEDFNINEMISQVIEKSRIIAGNRIVEFKGMNIPYLGDREKLERAFLNILGNAITHTGEDGRIYVELGKKDGILIAVSDNGSGIDEKDIPYIFERFYRGKNTRGGSGGLGLAIAREIVRAHGGDIKAYSKKGEGSKFEILLK